MSFVIMKIIIPNTYACHNHRNIIFKRFCSKMIVHIANTIYEIETSETLGIDASVTSIRWRDIQERIFNRIDPISDSGESYRLGLSNVTLYKGHARFLDNKKLEVGGKQLVAKNIVIATGAKPLLPEIPVHS